MTFALRKAFAAAAALAMSAGLASAHVTLEADRVQAGSFYKAVLKVPHGCDGSATLKIRVAIPEGVIAVKPMPKAGWELSTTRGAYARAYKFLHGAQFSQGVKQIEWSGKLLDAHYDEFVFSTFIAAELGSGPLYFPVTQTCEKGEAAWTQVPAEGEDSHGLKTPAPELLILSPEDAHAGHGAGGHSHH